MWFYILYIYTSLYIFSIYVSTVFITSRKGKTSDYRTSVFIKYQQSSKKKRNQLLNKYLDMPEPKRYYLEIILLFEQFNKPTFIQKSVY